MTTRLHHTDSLDLATTNALRSLDPASVDPQVAAGPVAQANLSRILATDSAEPTTPLSVNTGWARRPRRRWVVAGVTLVGVGALAVAPGMLGGQSAVAPSVSKNKAVAAPRPLGGNTAPRALGGHTEFASWSPIATDLTPAEEAMAGKRCKAQELHFVKASNVRAHKTVDSSLIRLVDRRGAWTLVSLSGGATPSYQATCLYEFDSHGAIRSAGGSGGSGGPGPEPVAPNSVNPSGGSFGNANGTTYYVTGPVGSDVVSVVINTIEQGPVKATVRGGYFGAWWPGPAWEMPKNGTPMRFPPAPTFTLTLKDGTIRANIPQAQLHPRSPNRPAAGSATGWAR
jgi:hypothetical protein